MSSVKVVAISGASGCGKTSVIKQLAKDHDCPYLLFDQFSDEQTYPTDMKQWFKDGGDVAAIKSPQFVRALADLRQQCDTPFIFIEEPFGRQRAEIAGLIDVVVLLDLPMEVCLSRVIMRNIELTSGNSLTAIARYLAMYDDYFRHIYIAVTNQVRGNCDLNIDQVTTIKATASIISQWLKNGDLSADRHRVD